MMDCGAPFFFFSNAMKQTNDILGQADAGGIESRPLPRVGTFFVMCTG